MTSRPLLYVCVRPQRAAAVAEYRSFQNAMHLGPNQLHAHNLVTQPLPSDIADRYAGVVIGGSPFNVSDPAKSDNQRRVEADLERLAAAAAQERIAALFTCFGIGVVSRLLGADVTLEYPEEASATLVTLTPDAALDPLTRDLPPQFHVLTAHKEASTLPENAVLLATNADCPVHMYRYGTRLYATQFHPEPTTADFTYRMTIYRDGGYFDPADYDRVAAEIESADVTHPVSLLHNFVALAQNQ